MQNLHHLNNGLTKISCIRASRRLCVNWTQLDSVGAQLCVFVALHPVISSSQLVEARFVVFLCLDMHEVYF